MPKSHLFVLIVLTLVVCAPLFRPGLYTSPDGENHLVRLAWFSQYLTAGHLYPRWIAELNHGLGYPIFTFTYPLPYYLASLPVLLGLSLVTAIKITLVAATFISAVFSYLWIGKLFPSSIYPLASASLFLFSPYRFTNLYVRLALGEVVWLALIPAIFWSLESRHWRLAAAFLAAAILSHLQLSAVVVVIIVAYSLVRRLSWVWPVVCGLLLSAFFWLPALILKQYTFFGVIRQFPPADHLPTIRQLLYSPWGFGFSHPGLADGMSFQLGLANWLVLGLASMLLLRLSGIQRLALALCWLTVGVMTSSPLGLWDWPLLAPIQFPWRLAVIPLLLIPVLLSVVRSKIWLVLILLLAIYSNRNHIRTNLPQFVGVSDTSFFQTTTTTATPKELMPKVYTAGTPQLFSSSPIIITSTVLSLITAGTMWLWPRFRSV